MYKYASAIGVDIGRFSLRIAVVNMDGDILLEESVPLNKEQERDTLILSIKDSIQLIRQKAATEVINPIAVGIAAKGFVDHLSGVVHGPDHGIAGWKDVPLGKIISRETGLPTFVGNDANLMTIAEQKYGAAKGYMNVVFIALRTGIGGGIIINGKLYRGVNDAGGEIGQMIVNYSGEVSEIGIRGSLEYYASASALVRRYSEESGKSADVKNESISAKEIFNLSYKGDQVAMKIIDENANLIGIGLANLITIFAPEIIVIGGGMSEANQSYLNKIRESAFINSLENCRSSVKVERAHLGQRAAVMGGAYYSLTRLARNTF